VASFTSESAKRAVAARWAGTTPEDRRRSTAAARREHAVREIVAQWPELRPEQIQKLRSLLQQPGGGHDGA
jgi:hypothetical protein